MRWREAAAVAALIAFKLALGGALLLGLSQASRGAEPPASHGNSRDRGLAGEYDEHNPFARMLRGELPVYKVYEDEHTLAFIPLRMRTRGHALVIPKAKARNVTQIDPADLAHVMATVQKVAKAQVAAFGAEGVTLVQNNGEVGDQSVFHLHVHVIPRYRGVEMRSPLGEDDPVDERKEAADMLAAFFAQR